MSWLRDKMREATPPFRSFGSLARACEKDPNWPSSTQATGRSLATLFSKLDRGEIPSWLDERPEVQAVLGQLLGCGIEGLRASFRPEESTKHLSGHRFRLAAYRGLQPVTNQQLTLPPFLAQLWGPWAKPREVVVTEAEWVSEIILTHAKQNRWAHVYENWHKGSAPDGPRDVPWLIHWTGEADEIEWLCFDLQTREVPIVLLGRNSNGLNRAAHLLQKNLNPKASTPQTSGVLRSKEGGLNALLNWSEFYVGKALPFTAERLRELLSSEEAQWLKNPAELADLLVFISTLDSPLENFQASLCIEAFLEQKVPEASARSQASWFRDLRHLLYDWAADALAQLPHGLSSTYSRESWEATVSRLISDRTEEEWTARLILRRLKPTAAQIEKDLKQLPSPASRWISELENYGILRVTRDGLMSLCPSWLGSALNDHYAQRFKDYAADDWGLALYYSTPGSSLVRELSKTLNRSRAFWLRDSSIRTDELDTAITRIRKAKLGRTHANEMCVALLSLRLLDGDLPDRSWLEPILRETLQRSRFWNGLPRPNTLELKEDNSIAGSLILGEGAFHLCLVLLAERAGYAELLPDIYQLDGTKSSADALAFLLKAIDDLLKQDVKWLALDGCDSERSSQRLASFLALAGRLFGAQGGYWPNQLRGAIRRGDYNWFNPILNLSGALSSESARDSLDKLLSSTEGRSAHLILGRKVGKSSRELVREAWELFSDSLLNRLGEDSTDLPYWEEAPWRLLSLRGIPSALNDALHDSGAWVRWLADVVRTADAPQQEGLRWLLRSAPLSSLIQHLELLVQGESASNSLDILWHRLPERCSQQLALAAKRENFQAFASLLKASSASATTEYHSVIQDLCSRQATSTTTRLAINSWLRKTASTRGTNAPWALELLSTIETES